MLALIRFSRAGGTKSFEFFDKFAAFKQRLNELPPRTCVIVFGQRQLPLRGLVDDELVGQALDLVADGTHYLITGLTKEIYGKAAWFFPEFDGMTHDEMNDDLDEMRGKLIAIGSYPPWRYDGDDIISAVVPDEDGSVTAGIY